MGNELGIVLAGKRRRGHQEQAQAQKAARRKGPLNGTASEQQDSQPVAYSHD